MKSYNEPIELIVKRPIADLQSKTAQKSLRQHFTKAGIQTEIISKPLHSSGKKKFAGKAMKTGSTNVIVKTNAKDTEVNPWDMAHVSMDSMGNDASYIEPNFAQEFVVDRKIDVPAKKITAKTLASVKSADDYDPDWLPHKNIIWHLGDGYSQLKSARDSVSEIDYIVRIGHLDTGYSQTHFVVPDSIRQNLLQHNFIDGESPNDAHDPLIDGFMKQPGHGTGTLGILAGTKIDIPTDDGRFQDYLGGAYFADVICCRIAPSVILMKTGTFADALDYLTNLTLNGTPVHVVSMSMGGAPSRVWADAVNAAYDAGITIVTASGNNFAGLPTRHVVYPARFGRVIAACGVTNDYKPYYIKKMKEMQGCFGPKRHMKKALSAFTPNTPWASVSLGSIMFSGAGTSSATPQIAAAAAIYYRKYHEELDQLPQRWQRVEAIRNALFKSALKKVNNQYDEDFSEYFGNGIIKANDALKISVPPAASLNKTDEDRVPWFPILSTIFKAKPSPQQNIRLEMFNTELAQLVFNNPELQKLIDDDKKDYDKVSSRKWKKFKEAVIDNPSASVVLRKYLEETTTI